MNVRNQKSSKASTRKDQDVDKLQHTQFKVRQKTQIEPKKLVLVMSGFETTARGELKHFISQVPGLILESHMPYTIQVVVSNSIWTDKCKVANILNIPIVNKNWVLDSYQKQEIQPFENYILGIFTGVRIGLFGFSEDEYEQIHSFITKENGITTREVQEILIPSPIRTIIVVKIEKYQEIGIIINQTGHIVCEPEWLKQCFKRRRFVDYHNYTLPSQVVQDSQEIYQELSKLSLHQFFDESSLFQNNYLEGVVAHVQVKDEKLAKLLQRFISLGDGFYIDQLLPSITHLITFDKPQQSQTYVVHPNWIRDCFLYRKRVNEIDYTIRQTPQVIPELILADEGNQRITRHSSLSQTFGLQQGPFQNNTSAINSTKNSHVRALSFTNEMKIIQQFQLVKSKIFNGFSFFVIEACPQAKQIRQLVKDYGGQCEIFKDSILKNDKDLKPTITLLTDTNENPKISKKIQTNYIFSVRWVQYCIERKSVELKVKEKKLVHLLPTNYKTPLEQLIGVEIYVCVLSIDDKIAFREIVQILTGKQTTKFNHQTLQYFVCNKEKSKKLVKVDKSKIRPPSWLLEIFLKGKFLS